MGRFQLESKLSLLTDHRFPTQQDWLSLIPVDLSVKKVTSVGLVG